MSTSRQANEAWWMNTERQERELAQATAARRRVDADTARALRRLNCAQWVARRLPDLVTDQHGPCSLAIGAALEVKRLTGRQPTPGEVRRYRELWMNEGSRVAKGWLVHTAGLEPTDRRAFVKWDPNREQEGTRS